MLTLRTLGSLNLRDSDGEELTAVLSQPKRFGLLVYLAGARPRGLHRRDTLLTLFWPERDDAHGRNALSQSLSFLRRHLPEGAVVRRGTEEVGLEPGALRLDVDDFETAIEEGRWAEALALYGGDFLRGFHVGETWGFEDWVESERVRLREAACSAAWALAGEYVEGGMVIKAERAAPKALELVCADETPARKFIQKLADAGDRGAALRFYERFAALLREELELEPSPETVAVIEEVRRRGEVSRPAEGVSSHLSEPQPQPAAVEEERSAPSGPKAPPIVEEKGILQKGRRTLIATMALIPILLFGAWRLFWSPLPEPEGIHVLVLPEEPTGDIEEDAFQAGMHHRLISCMNTLSALSAVPRYTAKTLPESGRTLQEFATALHAEAFLEWRSWRSADSVRVSLNLYRVSPGQELVGTSDVSVPVHDQATLCRQLAAGLAVDRGSLSQRLRLAFRLVGDGLDPEAQSAYDLGRYSLEERSAPAFERAVRQFNLAIEKDSTFAEAYSGLAMAKVLQVMFYFRPSREEAPLARAAAARAIALDSTLAESHLAAAFVKYNLEWDWAGAEASVQRAIALDGSSVEALLLYARLLRSLGRMDEALVFADRAKEMSPFDRRARVSWARMLADAGRLEESIREHHEVLEIWPDWRYGSTFMGQSYQATGELEKAAEIYRDLYREYQDRESSRDGCGDLAFFASVFGQVGDRPLAEEILQDLLERRAAGEFVASDAIAWILGGLGRVEEGMDWLLQAHEEGEHGMIHLLSWQSLDPFRSDPRFQGLVDTVFGEYGRARVSPEMEAAARIQGSDSVGSVGSGQGG